jgi:hypothetical protein
VYINNIIPLISIIPPSSVLSPHRCLLAGFGLSVELTAAEVVKKGENLIILSLERP